MVTKELTFQDLEEMEPGLKMLYQKAKGYKAYKGYCPLTTWYKEFKPVLVKLVGWFAVKQDKTLKSCDAYELAYKTVMEALPVCPKRCKGCG